MHRPPNSDIQIKPIRKPSNPFPVSETEKSLSVPEIHPSIKTVKPWWMPIRWSKIILFLISLYLFVLAIMFMKEGASMLTPMIRNTFRVDSPANSLGFGWLFAYVIMSGSPVAAAALAFFDSGVVSKLGAFAMITGSRLGAGFIVLLIGFLYVLRGRNRATSLSMGLLSLSITWSTYFPAFFLGILLLQTGVLDTIQINRGFILQSFTDSLVSPITNLVSGLVPQSILFVIGIGIICVSFNLFDKCLPQIAIKESQVGWASRLVYRTFVMFVLGALVTLVSMSVSISLSILVPLSNRGFIRRENVIPYIMGANITTFIDTLLAAVLLGNPPAFTLVLVEMITITLISLIILGVCYSRYQKMILAFVNRITQNSRNLTIFLVVIFLLPIFLLLI
jgi:sodium-dependent phosphate cotransporter